MLARGHGHANEEKFKRIGVASFLALRGWRPRWFEENVEVIEVI
jgi:hypothetical protein